ncbi:zinc finger protein SNAI2-like isoform X2 [Neocloeon triangulifer]|uniref:zinc finger protein SNAI2-like isoform X2 n=1 Tax=Neocloeon triangulifer TaxID=2078957 RepID=UPI00286F984E|nr:zinc finger protein SNAI2-like isoform X2 [Neocloeon triangulifer]
MPRAFLITHRRYNNHPVEQKECSPERTVSLPEQAAPHLQQLPQPLYPEQPATMPVLLTPHQSDSYPDLPEDLSKSSTTSTPAPPPSPPCVEIPRVPLRDDPDSLYNLTQLAEVSLLHPDLHGCPDCGKSTSSNLARHRQTHRSLEDKKARRCPHCDKVYVSMPAYSMHVRTHNQGCKCPYCGKCFSRPWLLQGHIRTHTGEKPFRCNVCSKAFADKSNLRAHVQTHSNTKPFICGRCGKAFALKSYLYKHEESSCMKLNRTHEASSSSSGSSPSSPRSVDASEICRGGDTPRPPFNHHIGLHMVGQARNVGIMA